MSPLHLILSLIGYLQLVAQALNFISTAIHSGYHKSLFSSRDTIKAIVEGVVVPNVSLREHEVEQFEDDPLEYIQVDLALSSSGLDSGTRRQASADLLRSLVNSGHEAETTEVVGSSITAHLATYNKAGNWKAKDSAIFLLTAVATKGSTTKVNSLSPFHSEANSFPAWCHINQSSCRCHSVLL